MLARALNCAFTPSYRDARRTRAALLRRRAPSDATVVKGALGFFVAATENGEEGMLRRAVKPTRHGSDGARRDDALGYSMRALAGKGKGHLQMIGRGLKLDVEDRTEEELRGMLTDLWRSWTPEMILDKLMPEDKPANVLNIHCLEELLLTLKQLELSDTLVVCYYWKFNCYACKSVAPKLFKMAKVSSQATFLRINYMDFPEYCTSLNVVHLPYVQLYRGSTGLVDAFPIPITNIGRLRDCLSRELAPRCALACPLACPYPPPPTWTGLETVNGEVSTWVPPVWHPDQDQDALWTPENFVEEES